MATLTSCSFRLTPPNRFNFRVKIKNINANFCLCGASLSKRRRMISKGNCSRLNLIVRSCYNDKNNTRNENNATNGEGENRDNSNLATMSSTDEKPDDNSENLPTSISNRVRFSLFFSHSWIVFNFLSLLIMLVWEWLEMWYF